MRLGYSGILWSWFLLERLALYFCFPLSWDLAYERMQNLDILALKSDYWSALWNLHMQPPLFNAILGVIAKFVPDAAAAIVVQAIYFGLAILSFVAVRGILAHFMPDGGRRRLFEIGYTLLPTTLFTERWFTYTCPVSCGLLWCMLFTLHYRTSGRLRHLLGCGLVGLGIVLTRSFFHPLLWFAPILALAAWGGPQRRTVRTFVIACFLSVAAVPNVVNYARYGMFTSSTWQGMNLFNTLRYVTTEERSVLVKQGKIAPVCALQPFMPPEMYFNALSVPPDPQRVPAVLHALRKTPPPSGGEPTSNLNHGILPMVSRKYQDGWLPTVLNYPRKYIMGMLNGIYIFFSLEPYRFWDNAAEWLPDVRDAPPAWCFKAIRVYVIPVALALLYMSALWGFLRAKGSETRTGAWIGLFTLAYVLGLGCLAELAENCILRTPADPLVLLGLACLASGRSAERDGTSDVKRHAFPGIRG